MSDNLDQMARIEREIEKRMEAACEKDGWVVSVAMMPPERTTLHIEKFGEVPVTDDDAQAAQDSAVAFAKAEFGTSARRSSGSTRRFPTPAHRTMLRSSSRLTPRSASQSWRRNMNMEQRAQQYAEIQKLEGLLAYAVAHGDKAEEERIRAELVRMVGEL